ncbi:hypothetical protein [uncultured Hyphomicrobium sp.]|nr:hypothetical protein [uncultured Hyphomicrobium sp.]
MAERDAAARRDGASAITHHAVETAKTAAAAVASIKPVMGLVSVGT